MTSPPTSPSSRSNGLESRGRSTRASGGLSKSGAYEIVKAEAQEAVADGRKIWLTGHSLGGALATLCAYRLHKQGVPVRGVITIGSPRVGNPAFANDFNSMFGAKSTRWVDDDDFVTQIPPELGGPLEYRHVGSSITSRPTGQRLSERVNGHAQHERAEQRVRAQPRRPRHRSLRLADLREHERLHGRREPIQRIGDFSTLFNHDPQHGVGLDSNEAAISSVTGSTTFRPWPSCCSRWLWIKWRNF